MASQQQAQAQEAQTTTTGPGRPRPVAGGRGNGANAEALRRRQGQLPQRRPGGFGRPTESTQGTTAPTETPTTEAPTTTAPTTTAPTTTAPTTTTEGGATTTEGGAATTEGAATTTEGAATQTAATTPVQQARTDLATAAVATVGALPGCSDALRTRIQDAVRAAAGAAFDAALDAERRGRNPNGVPADFVDTAEVIAAARTRYTNGPGVAVRRFPDYVVEARQQLRVAATTQTDAVYTRALEILDIRCRRSVSTYTNIQTNSRITLATEHPSGVDDDAHPSDNVRQVVEGRTLARSDYGNAPGGRTSANDTVLEALAAITRAPYNYSVRVSELAGASHSPNSAHYDGDAIDIDMVNGAGVSASNRSVRGLKQAFRDLGASLVLGPGDPDHDTHVHAQW